MKWGAACKCTTSHATRVKHWVVREYRRKTISYEVGAGFAGTRNRKETIKTRRSTIECEKCGAVWRTAASFVESLVKDEWRRGI